MLLDRFLKKKYVQCKVSAITKCPTENYRVTVLCGDAGPPPPKARVCFHSERFSTLNDLNSSWIRQSHQIESMVDGIFV